MDYRFLSLNLNDQTCSLLYIFLFGLASYLLITLPKDPQLFVDCFFTQRCVKSQMYAFGLPFDLCRCLFHIVLHHRSEPAHARLVRARIFWAQLDLLSEQICHQPQLACHLVLLAISICGSRDFVMFFFKDNGLPIYQLLMCPFLHSFFYRKLLIYHS